VGSGVRLANCFYCAANHCSGATGLYEAFSQNCFSQDEHIAFSPSLKIEFNDGDAALSACLAGVGTQ
jgi:hypothetical protein